MRRQIADRRRHGEPFHAAQPGPEHAGRIALARSAGDRRFEGIVLGNRADLHWDAGEIEEAHALYARALAIHREVGNRRFEGITLSNLGTAAAAIGDVEAARAAQQSGTTGLDEVGVE